MLIVSHPALPAQDPAFHITNCRLVGLAGRSLPDGNLEHAKQANDGVERVIRTMWEAGFDCFSEAALDNDVPASSPVLAPPPQ